MAFFDFLHGPEHAVGSTFGFLKNNVVIPTINAGKNAADVGYAGHQASYGLARALGQEVAGRKDLAEATAGETIKRASKSLNASRGAYTAKEALSDKPMDFLKPLSRNVGAYAPYFVGGGAAGVVEGGAAKIAVAGGTQAVIGAGATAAQELGTTGKLDPKEIAKNAVVQGAFGAGGEAVTLGVKGAAHAPAKLREVADTQASHVSGLKATQIVNENEAGTLRDWASYKMGDYKPKPSVVSELDRQTRNAAKTAGIDVTSGSARDIATRIEDYISQRTQHLDARTSVLEGGYINLGGKDAENLAKNDQVGKIKKELAGKVPAPAIDFVAPAVARTSDPNIVKNIVDRTAKLVDTAQAPSIIPEQPTVPTGESILGGLAVGDKPRGFIKTLKNSENSSPELKQAAGDITPQTYAPKANQTLVDNARTTIDKDPVAALTDLMAKDHFTDQDVATAQEVVRRSQTKPGGIDDSTIALVDRLDNKLRDSGRAVQAASLWGRLSPEGILKLAARKVRKVREASGKFENETPTAQELKQTIEGFAPEDQPRVQAIIQKTVKDIANEQQALPLEGIDRRSGVVENTGQKLAKNVEKAASPQVKKKVDTLVAELTKKVKQEYLDPKVTTKRSPTTILQEVFGRSAEAKEAYPLAQKILQERYKNVPTMQKALEKFFGSKLEHPAAESTISNAVKEQLRNNNVKVSKAIFESWANQGQTVDSVAKSLVKEGFDKSSADYLAKEVTARLNKQFAEAKINTLERMSAGAPKRVQATFAEKISKLSNLGALDDQDYLQLARTKLKLPELTTESAKNISELAQKMQGLPEGYDKFKLLDQITEEIQKNIPTSAGDIAKQLLSSPKAALSAFDISGGGRQGAVLATRFPKQFAESFANQAKYAVSQEAFDRSMAAHATSKNAAIYDAWGIDYAKPGSQFHEEAFAKPLIEKVPIAGQGIKASERAFTGLLSDLRTKSADVIIENFKKEGVDVTKWPESWQKSMGRYINEASGRGVGKAGGVFEKWAPFLGDTLFSPRLWKSRLDMLNPKYYYDLKGPARAYALQSAASFASVAGTVMGLAVMAGASVETDARSSDFMKVKVGDTRYDILGGFQQNIVFAWREISGEKKSSTTGAITKLGDKYGAADRLSIIGDFVQNKENPVLAAGSRIVRGKDIGGNPVSPATEVGKLFVPLGIQDTYSTVKNVGNVPKGIAKAAPGFVGVGVGTYGTKDLPLSDKQKATIQLLEQKGASKEHLEAYKAFYQTAKEAAGTRTNVNDKITEALTAGDTAKARKLAADYNKKYAASFKVWLQKYGTYEDKALAKEYNAKKIKLTSASVKTRTKNIKTNPLYQVTLGGK